MSKVPNGLPVSYSGHLRQVHCSTLLSNNEVKFTQKTQSICHIVSRWFLSYVYHVLCLQQWIPLTSITMATCVKTHNWQQNWHQQSQHNTRSVNQLEMLHKNKPALERYQHAVINLLHTSSWPWTLVAPPKMCIQLNPSNTSLGPPKCVLIGEVSSFQGANNTYLYEVGTWSSVLIREVSSFQGCPLRGVPL